MVQRRSLPDVDKGRALAWLQGGATYRAVAHRLGVSPSVVWRLQERWRATERVQDRPRSGRPKKTDARADRYIVRQALTSRTITAERIRGQLRVATNIQVSTQTIRNRLHNVRLRSRVPAKKPKLTPVHKRARRDWSARHSR
ncbi:uncharacterized protein [Littorina saxatilis]